nr:MAG TPA: hypothetical protein [Caudoviricetes sp.]
MVCYCVIVLGLGQRCPLFQFFGSCNLLRLLVLTQTLTEFSAD